MYLSTPKNVRKLLFLNYKESIETLKFNVNNLPLPPFDFRVFVSKTLLRSGISCHSVI